MQGLPTTSPTISSFPLQYEHYLLRVRGLARSTRNLHRYFVHRLFTSRFPGGQITWSDLRFSDFVKEFARLPSRDTQRAWLMILRSVQPIGMPFRRFRADDSLLAFLESL